MRRAMLKQRQLEEEVEMRPKGKRGRPQEEEAGKKSKIQKIRPQEEDTTPGPADPQSSRGPRQASPSLEDYNVPTPERTELLINLKKLLKVELVSTTFWACCQLSDIEALKVVVSIAKMKPSIVIGFDNLISNVPRLWIQRPGNSSAWETGEPSTRAPSGSNRTNENPDGEKWVPCSEKASELCKQRDDGKCVLTKAGDPDAAHIFPYSILNKSANTPRLNYTAQANFWVFLRVFWDDDHVDKWRNKIFPDPQHPDTGFESCFNLICLAKHAHGYWNSGRFALKPLSLSDDEKDLTVQFFWQPQYDHKYNDRVDLLKEPLSSEGLKFLKKGKGAYFLCRLSEDLSTRYIQSGDIFTLTTDDPGSRPLPSWELLEMQWILQRITAMSGAAETPELDLNDDYDINSRPSLIPDYNSGDIRSNFDRVYKWIPCPSLPGSVPSMAKQAIGVQCEPNQENPKEHARDMPRQVVNVS